MDSAIQDFCSHVGRSDYCLLVECGITEDQQFIFGRSVSESEHLRFLTALQQARHLSTLIGKRYVTPLDIQLCYTGDSVSTPQTFHLASAATASQTASAISPGPAAASDHIHQLSKNVTLVLYQSGQ